MIGKENEINVYVNDFNSYTTRNDNRHTGDIYRTMMNRKFTCRNVTVNVIYKKKTNSKHTKIFLAMNISFCENVLFVYKILNMYMCVVDFCGFYQPV